MSFQISEKTGSVTMLKEKNREEKRQNKWQKAFAYLGEKFLFASRALTKKAQPCFFVNFSCGSPSFTNKSKEASFLGFRRKFSNFVKHIEECLPERYNFGRNILTAKNKRYYIKPAF